MAIKKTKLPYVIVRDNRSGVYAGVLEFHNQINKTAVLTEARQIWQWQDRLSTSDIANRGVGAGSKVVDPVLRKELNDVVDVSFATSEAEKNIREFAPWRR